MSHSMTVGDLRRSRARVWLTYQPMTTAPKDREIWVACHGPRGWYGRLVMWDDGRQKFTDDYNNDPGPLGWCDTPALPEAECTPQMMKGAFCPGRIWEARILNVVMRYQIDAVGWGEDGQWTLKASDLMSDEKGFEWPLLAFIEWVKVTGARLIDVPGRGGVDEL